MASNKYRTVLSPGMSSPERMEFSDESSLEQSPMMFPKSHRLPKQQSRKEVSLSRRVSCPPPMYGENVYFKERFGIETPKQNMCRRSTGGDFLDSIDKDFGFMQLDSPPGNVHFAQSTPLSVLSNKPSYLTSSKSTGKSSVFSLFATESEPICEDDRDSSQRSKVSISTVKADNNNEYSSDKQQALIAKNLTALSSNRKNEIGDSDDDRMSSISKSSFKTTGAERAKVKEFAQSSSRNSQCLCYIHSMVLCLAIVILGYFGTSEIQKQWCISSQSINVTNLKAELQSKVFGQHIAVDLVTQAFNSFFNEEKSVTLGKTGHEASLVLSFHGWTGIGKTYISNIISDLFSKPRITKLIIPLHFPHTGEEFSLRYEDSIKEWILSNISSCAINLFIVDEMDKATEPLIKGLTSAIQTIHSKMWNNTKIVILLLSNTAGNAINKAVFMHLNDGNKRRDLNLEIMKNVILNEDFATWHKDLYNKGLIDHIVPFLPLQLEHVEKCIKSYLKNRDTSLPYKKIAQIAKDFEYFPHGNPIFSKTGCKRVSAKTDLFLE